MTDLTVSISKTLQAPIEKVFDAWLTPGMLSQFVLPMPGMPEPEVEIDARVGGAFTIMMQVGEDKLPHSGEYLELDRPNKLVFSWVSPFSTQGSTVTLELKAQNENTTKLDLTHVKFADEESRNNHEGGWSNILEKLGEVLA